MPMSRKSGTVLVTWPTTADTTRVSATFKTQNLRERTVALKLVESTTGAGGVGAGFGTRAAPEGLGTRNRQARGSVSTRGSSPIRMKPARQSQRSMAQLSAGGSNAA